MDLLYGGLREHGVDCVAEPPLTIRWLARSRKTVDVLHFHWRPDRYYASYRRLRRSGGLPRRLPRFQNARSWLRLGLFACRLRLARILGFRLVWTIHEIYPPQTLTRPDGAVSRRVDRVGSRLLAASCDLLLAHDHATAAKARQELGLERIEVVPHASYLGFYAPGRPPEIVRRELAIDPDAFVFLCFGAIRPDKSIGLVVDAFRGIPRPDVALVVAGLVEDTRSGDAVREAAGEDERIVALLGRVPDDRVAELHAAAGACVHGRGESWTSGSMILALSLGVPVIAADLAPYDELTAYGRAGWLYRPGDVRSLRAAMDEAAADAALAQAKGRAALDEARMLPTWAEVGEATARLILQSCNGHRRRSTDSASARSAGVFTP
jgi:glycosyltransferase involved in cell wall biosynthesis